VTSVGTKNDLRLVFPYMLVAAKPYIATNTGQKVEVKMPADDPQVIQLRGGTTPVPVPK